MPNWSGTLDSMPDDVTRSIRDLTEEDSSEGLNRMETLIKTLLPIVSEAFEKMLRRRRDHVRADVELRLSRAELEKVYWALKG